MDDYNKIPKDMKRMKNWIVCKNMMAFSPNTGKIARPKTSTTWGTFTEAIQAYSNTADNYEGIGFMFSGSGLIGINIDNCFLNGKLIEQAASIVEMLDSFTEISTNGRSIHIIMKGNVPGVKNRHGNYSIYNSNCYFVMTGNVLKDVPVSADQDRINDFYQKYISTDPEKDEAMMILANLC